MSTPSIYARELARLAKALQAAVDLLANDCIDLVEVAELGPHVADQVFLEGGSTITAQMELLDAAHYALQREVQSFAKHYKHEYQA